MSIAQEIPARAQRLVSHKQNAQAVSRFGAKVEVVGGKLGQFDLEVGRER